MIERNDILGKAYIECLQEMYKWSQPSIDIKELIDNGFKDSSVCPLYSIHYLSSDNFEYIRDRFMEAYRITDDWDDTFDTIYRQLEQGGIERDYESVERYKKVKALKSLLNEDDYKLVVEYLNKIQKFFKWHRREINQFRMSIAFGASPTTNAKSVEKYWKEHGRPNFKIKEFNIEDVIYGDITEDEFTSTLK
jgi:hypothetical protein